jgi:hypothetical protein
MEPQPSIDLRQYGIDIGLLISGLFGAILLTSKSGALNLTRTISSLIAGAASANYITPVIITITKLDDKHFHYSIAFLLGFLGLKGVEYVSAKVLPDNLTEIEPVTPTAPRRKRIKRK